MNRIQELRKAAGMKQTDLAALLSSSRQAVGKWETGAVDVSTETIADLCRIFGVSADYLLGMSDQRTTQISAADAGLVDAYHAATPEIRAIVDTALAPYKEKRIEAAG